jgi:hypothetical protein
MLFGCIFHPDMGILFLYVCKFHVVSGKINLQNKFARFQSS